MERKMKHKIICGKSEIELKQFEDNTFDSCVTDPPYNLTSMTRPRPDQTKTGDYGKEVLFSRVQSRMNGGFMGKEWDGTGISFNVKLWEEVYRVMKPGSHILVAGIARTHHRLWTTIEDAGFNIIDGVYHIFGSGFPKNTDISKQIDKMKGKEREVIGIKQGHEEFANRGNLSSVQSLKGTLGNKGGFARPWMDSPEKVERYHQLTAPTSEEAIQYDGFGTALKPAVEIWCLARKPISERNIASNVLKWGCGGINVGKCRISHLNKEDYLESTNKNRHKDFNSNNGVRVPTKGIYHGDFREPVNYEAQQGRYPANLILECCCEDDELVEGEIGKVKVSEAKRTHGEWLEKSGFGGITKRTTFMDKAPTHTNPNCVCRMLDEQSGESKSTDSVRHNNQSEISGIKGIYGKYNDRDTTGFNDKGGCSRFFYQAKASQKERWFYCTICKEAYPMKERDKHIHAAPEKEKYKYLEFHPTAKPEKLIEYLMRLITPPNGNVLDPFLGSGTGLIAAEREGFNATGIDSKREYCKIAERRIKSGMRQLRLDKEPSIIEKIGF